MKAKIIIDGKECEIVLTEDQKTEKLKTLKSLYCLSSALGEAIGLRERFRGDVAPLENERRKVLKQMQTLIKILK